MRTLQPDHLKPSSPLHSSNALPPPQKNGMTLGGRSVHGGDCCSQGRILDTKVACQARAGSAPGNPPPPPQTEVRNCHLVIFGRRVRGGGSPLPFIHPSTGRVTVYVSYRWHVAAFREGALLTARHIQGLPCPGRASSAKERLVIWPKPPPGFEDDPRIHYLSHFRTPALPTAPHVVPRAPLVPPRSRYKFPRVPSATPTGIAATRPRPAAVAHAVPPSGSQSEIRTELGPTAALAGSAAASATGPSSAAAPAGVAPLGLPLGDASEAAASPQTVLEVESGTAPVPPRSGETGASGTGGGKRRRDADVPVGGDGARPVGGETAPVWAALAMPSADDDEPAPRRKRQRASRADGPLGLGPASSGSAAPAAPSSLEKVTAASFGTGVFRVPRRSWRPGPHRFFLGGAAVRSLL